jgi:hypothetical protein
MINGEGFMFNNDVCIKSARIFKNNRKAPSLLMETSLGNYTILRTTTRESNE